jgi:dihydrofolate reductase
MAYSIKKEQIIDYPPEKLKSFYKNSFEWIDNLNFTLSPFDCLDNAEEYIKVAKEIFTDMGWYGDGDVQLIWIPPFMFDGIHTPKFTKGIIVWHVKQEEDGISWILSPFDFYSCEKQWIVFKEDVAEMRELGEKQGMELNKRILLKRQLMEKKNIVFIAKSLDGYIAGKNGELDWLESIPNPDNVEMGFASLMQEIDAIVMGRTTFEVVCHFSGDWPYTKPVIVLSNSLKEAPEKLNQRVSIMKGKPQEIIIELHKRGFFKLYIDGGRTVQGFLKADLIDELRITTIPILLGGGFPLFGDLDVPLEFDHIESKVFLNQIVQNHYRRKRK